MSNSVPTNEVLFGGDNVITPLFSICTWIYGFAVTIGSFAFGSFYGLIWILPFFVFIDTIVGILKARYLKESVTSAMFLKMIVYKTVLYGAVVGLALGLDFLFECFLLNGIDLNVLISWLPFVELLQKPIIVCTYTYLIVNESWSILENLVIMDSRLVPAPLKKIVKTLLNKFTETGDSEE